jgi:pilus assembly protein Flp/PilA
MTTFKQLLADGMRDESGQDLIEYALVAAVVGLGCVSAMSGLATSIANVLGGIGTTLTANV